MRRTLLAAALTFAIALPAQAQNELLRSCAELDVPVSGLPTTVTEQYQFLCGQVFNSLSNLQPSVGIAFAGGNPVLGTATTFGTRFGILPRVSVTARANVALAELPDLFDGYSARLTGSQLGAMGTTGIPIGSIQGDVSIGVFNGVSIAPMIGGIGSVDLLGSVAMLPQIEDFGLSEAIMNIGVGARIGILRQGMLVPGISISGMYRRMGEVAFGDLAAGDPGEFSTNLETLSLRAVASKGVLMFDLAVGAGYDKYSSDVDLGWILSCETVECVTVNGGKVLDLPGRLAGELSTAAWNVFADVSLNLLILNLVGEIGYQKAIDPIDLDALTEAGLPNQPMTTEELKGGRFFGSIGLRVAI